MKLFGFRIFDKEDSEDFNLRSVEKDPGDGSATVVLNDQGGGYGESYGFATTFDVDPLITDEATLITRYRQLSLDPEVEKAINAIIDEFLATNDDELVTLDLDNVEYSENVKKKIIDEFDHILKLLNFKLNSYDIIRRWYIDGRLQYQVVVDPTKYKQNGIGKLTYLDPRKLKKVKVYVKNREPGTNIDTFTDRKPFYVYSAEGFFNEYSVHGYTAENAPNGIRLSDDAVVQLTSGLLNTDNSIVLSYLHKAIRPANQLRSLEDAAVIYRIVRAPERRVFYIDVGNLPASKAEQVLKRQMQQYRSKVVYDASSGKVTADPRFMTMTEDYWLPRRADGKSTEIDTLPAGQNLGEMSEVNYFLNKLYNSLNVPISRMDPSAGFQLGRTTEITRDEVAFMKFIKRLRRRVGDGLFAELLKRQLALKGIMTPTEFEDIRQDIIFRFASDNHFDELLENEIMTERLNIVDRAAQYRGQWFSDASIQRDFLKRTEEEIDEMREEMDQERKEGILPPNDFDGMGDGALQPSASQVVYTSTSKKQNSNPLNTTDKAAAQPQASAQAPATANPTPTGQT